MGCLTRGWTSKEKDRTSKRNVFRMWIAMLCGSCRKRLNAWCDLRTFPFHWSSSPVYFPLLGNLIPFALVPEFHPLLLLFLPLFRMSSLGLLPLPPLHTLLCPLISYPPLTSMPSVTAHQIVVVQTPWDLEAGERSKFKFQVSCWWGTELGGVNISQSLFSLHWIGSSNTKPRGVWSLLGGITPIKCMRQAPLFPALWYFVVLGNIPGPYAADFFILTEYCSGNLRKK